MALFMISKRFKQSIYHSIVRDIFGKEKTKLKETVFNLSCLQCNYHNTQVYFNVHLKRKANRITMRTKLMNKPICYWKDMTVTDLAIASKESTEKIIEMLSAVDNITYTIDSILNSVDITKKIINKLGREAKDISENKKQINVYDNTDYQIDDILKRDPPDPKVLISRRPIITIMGHVDHGKTTLLDSLRKSSVADSEFGGITQHIGAFNVTLSNGEKITFLDTPGHAAFNAMRERGAHVTDIVILVVAADDGVMEQTVESIRMAHDADVPIVVAVNKIDKPNADIERTYKMLSNYGVIVEDLGGNIQSVNISARNGTNLDQLMEVILMQAEIMELKGDPTGFVEGVVIEATNNISLGKVTSLAIKRGTLKKGNILVSGLAWGKVRSIMDHTGTHLSEAKLSDVVQVTGWHDLPIVGEKAYEVENERKAQIIIKQMQANLNKTKSIEQKKVADEKYVNHLIHYKNCIKKQAEGIIIRSSGTADNNKDDDSSKLNVIIKGDVAGSIEAILDAIKTYDDKRCSLLVVTSGIGPVTATDLELAKTFHAVIYCFNTTIPDKISEEIKAKNLSVSQFNVIYKLIDDLKLRLTKKLPLITMPEEIGKGIVLKQFEIVEKKKKLKIAGCRCTSGSFKQNALFKIMRENKVIYDDNISEMRHLKTKVESLNTNVEGGLKLNVENIELKQGDVIICYKLARVPQSIEWNPGF